MSDLIVDLSNNNGTVDFAKLAAWGNRAVKGVICKASEGSSFVDKFFAYNRVQARKHGLPFGAYHFFDRNVAAEAQADFFCEVVKAIDTTDIRPVLDFEQLLESGNVDAIHTFNRTVEKKLHVLPIFYTSTSNLETLDLKVPVGSALWQADYGDDNGAVHPVPTVKPWKKPATLHQFTQHGRALGVEGDVDLSYGNLRGILAHPIRSLFV